MGRTLMLVAALAWSAGAAAQESTWPTDLDRLYQAEREWLNHLDGGDASRPWEERAAGRINRELGRVQSELAAGSFKTANERAGYLCQAVRLMQAMGLDDEAIGEPTVEFCDDWQ